MQTLISLGGILSGPVALEALIFLRLHAHPMDRDMVVNLAQVKSQKFGEV